MHLFPLLWIFNLGINGASVNSWQADAQCLLDQARSLLNVREVNANNRGPEVDKIILFSGGKPGQAWCGYFQKFIHIKCGRKSGNGYSPSWFIPSRLVKSNQIPGDVFSIYNSSLKRIAHIGMVEMVLPNGKFIVTIEGNTGTFGVRDGGGIYRLTRPTKSIYNFARWWNLRI